MMATNMPRGARRGAAAARAASTASTRSATRARPAGCAPTRATSTRSRHELTDEQIDKLATITPYATGATIKDLVNEALIIAIRDGRDIITWQRRDARPSSSRTSARPRTSSTSSASGTPSPCTRPATPSSPTATRQHMEIDIATIEKGGDYLGMVASIPPEDQFTRWRSEYEADILVSPRLAGRRADVLRRRQLVRRLRRPRVGHRRGRRSWRATGAWAPPCRRTRRRGGSRSAAPAAAAAARRRARAPRRCCARALADRIEDQLGRPARAGPRRSCGRTAVGVLALAHALETHKTLTGEDVEAVLDQRIGISVDGTVYSDPEFIEKLEEYHAAAAGAHIGHSKIDGSMPEGGRLAPPPGPSPSRSRSRRARTRGTATASRRATARLRPATASRVRGRAVRGTATRRPPGTAPTAVRATAVRATARATARRVTRRLRPCRVGVGPSPAPTRPPRPTARARHRPPGRSRAPTRPRRRTARAALGERQRERERPGRARQRPDRTRGVVPDRAAAPAAGHGPGAHRGRAAGRHPAHRRGAGRCSRSAASPRSPSPNGQTERRADAESNDDEDRPGRA